MSAYRSALLGMMGVKLGFIKQEALEAMEIASLDQAPPDLGSLLVANGHLSEADHETLSSLVDEAIRSRGGDEASLIEALNSGDDLVQTLQSAPTVEGGHDIAPEETFRTDPDLYSDDTIRTAPTLHGGDTIQTAQTINTGNDDTVVTDPNVDPMATKMDPRAGHGPIGEIPAVQETLGRYDELREFARGGMGKILLVHDTHLGREIALKQLLPDRLKAATRGGSLPTASLLTVPIIARFLQEARITGQLEHPSIVPVHELGFRPDGSLYYTMKFVRGKSMQDALKDCESLQDRLKLLTHFLDLCQAMAYAHSRGVIHRDLKPLNVMIGEFGETVVIDWGIAKLKGVQDIHAREMNEQVRSLRMGTAEESTKTMEGQTIGSPYFMPPEQSEGKTDEVNERSDIYALGAVLYTILAGQPPYKGLNVREFLEKVVSFDPKPITELESAAPPELVAIANRAMARKAEDRYQTAKELADEIEQFIAGGLVGAYQYSFKELFRRFVRKHAKILATAAAALIILIAVSVVSYVNIVRERNRAVEAEAVAVEQRGIAEEQRGIAEEQRGIAEVERREAVEKLYYANISLTQRSIEERLAEQAQALLDESPAEHRGWEWGHLHYEINGALENIEAGGRFALYFDEGRYFVTSSPNGTVGVYASEGRERQHTLIERAGFQHVLDASARGRHVVISADEAIHVWDGVSGEERFVFEEPNPRQLTRQVSLSQDGTRLAALCSDRQARVWDVATGAELLSYPVRQPNGAVVLLAPEGDKVFVAMKDMSVEAAAMVTIMRLLDVATGDEAGMAELVDPNSVHSAAFSPNGAHLAIGADEMLQIWSTSPWQRRHQISARFGHPNTLAFSSDSQWLGGGTRDGEVGVWAVATGEGPLLQNAHDDSVRAVAFSPDCGLLVTASYDRTAKLWEAPALRPLRTLRGHTKSLFAAAVNHDGTEVLTGGFENRTRVWDLRDTLNGAAATAMAFAASTGLAAGAVPEGIQLWDVATGHALGALAEPHVRYLGFAGDGVSGAAPLVAAIISERGAAQPYRALIWNHAEDEVTARWNLERVPNDMALAANGQFLALRTGTQLALYRIGENAPAQQWEGVQGFAFSPDGRFLAHVDGGGDAGHTLILWGLTENAALWEETVASAYTPTVAFTPDSSQLYFGGGAQEEGGNSGIIMAFPVAGGPAQSWSGHRAGVSAFAFSKDGSRVATGASDFAIVLWDPATGTALQQFDGHASNIQSLALSPDQKRLATASLDGTFKIWDMGNGREIMTLRSVARGSGVSAVNQPEEIRFSEDGKLLAAFVGPQVQAPYFYRAHPWDQAPVPSPKDAGGEDATE